MKHCQRSFIHFMHSAHHRNKRLSYPDILDAHRQQTVYATGFSVEPFVQQVLII